MFSACRVVRHVKRKGIDVNILNQHFNKEITILIKPFADREALFNGAIIPAGNGNAGLGQVLVDNRFRSLECEMDWLDQ